MATAKTVAADLDKQTDFAIKLGWYIGLRWIVLLLIGLAGTVSRLLDVGLGDVVVINTLTLITALGLNGLAARLARRWKRDRQLLSRVAAGLLVFDILAATFIIYVQGAIESRNIILYVFPIVIAGTIFGLRQVYWTSAAAIVCYVGLMTLDWAGNMTGKDRPAGAKDPAGFQKRAI